MSIISTNNNDTNTMNLENYYQEHDGHIHFSREQASQFAKVIAGDFNPIHNPDHKRFCVPGDLLFACSLAKYGLSEHMHFRFKGMVGSDVKLNFTPNDTKEISVINADGKEFLSIEREGQSTNNRDLIKQLTEAYVAFSGFTFPHLLVPLMADKQVMINPQRPLVIYESMEINLSNLEASNITVEQAGTSLEVNGKRGQAILNFHLLDGKSRVGSGKKTMILSGLKPFDKTQMQSLVDDYSTIKENTAL